MATGISYRDLRLKAMCGTETTAVPFLCEVLSSREGVWPLLESALEGEVESAAASSVWADCVLVNGYSLPRSAAARAALGLIESGQDSKLTEIIKAGWPEVYSFVKSSAGAVRVEHLMHGVLGGKKERLDSMTNDLLNAFGLLAIALARHLGKPLDERDKVYRLLADMLKERMVWLSGGPTRFCWDNLPLPLRRDAERLRQETWARYGVNRFINSYGNRPELALWYEFTSYLFDASGLSFGMVEDETLKERDIDEVMAALLASFRHYGVEPDALQAGTAMVAGHVLKGLMRSYIRSKDYHWAALERRAESVAGVIRAETEALRSELATLKGVLAEKEAELERLRKRLDSEASRVAAIYEKRLRELEEENADLRGQLDRWRGRAAELEEALFSPEPEAAPGTAAPDLSRLRGLVVGGHPHWASGMRDALPDSWKVLGADDPFEPSVLAGRDVVCIYTAFISHSLYWSVKGAAKRRGVPVVHLRKGSVEELAAAVATHAGLSGGAEVEDV